MLKSELIEVGNTPIVKCNFADRDVYFKCEFANPYGSMKDRAAMNVITKGLKEGFINKETTIIESSSGNFGIALAPICKKYGLKFICVIDANTNLSIINQLGIYGAEIINIDIPDENGGYLMNRLAKVKEIIAENENIYWTCQYENPLVANSYSAISEEIFNDIGTPVYLFIPVSSGGTITGISSKMKELSPDTKIIAVDSVGSVIFGGKPSKRHIPGLGSSIVPPILKQAKIDEFMMIKESDMVNECHEFLDKNSMLIGGSSGACLHAVRIFCETNNVPLNSKIVTILPDNGERYVNTVYNKQWCESRFNKK